MVLRAPEREGRPMTKRLIGALAAAAMAVLLASCILLDNPEGEEPGWRTFPGSESPGPIPEFRRTVPFAPGGTLTLENDAGDVSVTGWDREEVEIVARAAVVEAGPEGAARPYRIRKVAPDVEIKETETGLLVRTRSFEGPGEAPAVDYEIKVPQDVVLQPIRMSDGDLAVADVYGRIEAAVDQGDCSIANFSGSLKVNVGDGNADVEVLDLREGDEVSVTSRQGDIVLRLEAGIAASVEANAPHGGVSSDFDLGIRLPAPSVKATIGPGGASIILMASNGRVRIIKTV
jgi:hypothetical protein